MSEKFSLMSDQEISRKLGNGSGACVLTDSRNSGFREGAKWARDECEKRAMEKIKAVAERFYLRAFDNYFGESNDLQKDQVFADFNAELQKILNEQNLNSKTSLKSE